MQVLRLRTRGESGVQVSEELGRKIADARKAAGLRQHHLAEAMGVGKSYVSMIESGDREPTDGQLAVIAGLLGKSVAELADFGLSTAEDVLGALLRLEAAGCGATPVLDASGRAGIAVDEAAAHAPKLHMALSEWARMRDALASGEIAEDDYLSWRDQCIL